MTTAQTLIGRRVDPLKDIALGDDPLASDKHAAVYIDQNEARFVAMQTKNGSFINGRPVPEKHVTRLHDGDVLRLGGSVFLFRREEAKPRDAPSRFRILHERLLGSAPALRQLRERIATVAPLRDSVLLWGATGTGKELAAKALHAVSGRRGELVTVNASAIVESLAEKELFGHEKGAFTGADTKAAGLFQRAHLGTLFLDEIGDLAPNLQTKLLRAVEEGAITPVGSDKPVKIDVRFVAATNQNLFGSEGTQSFRSELRARLSRSLIELPTLAERREDILLLFLHFLSECQQQTPKSVLQEIAQARRSCAYRLTARFVEKLLLWPWLQNVRELNTVSARTWLFLLSEVLHAETVEDLVLDDWLLEDLCRVPGSARPAPLAAADAVVALPRFKKRKTRRDFSRAEIVDALAQCSNSVVAAAIQLETSERTLRRCIQELGLAPEVPALR